MSVALDTLHEDVEQGDILLLNDGMIELQVDRVEGTRIHTIVTTGGILSDHKGINKKGGGLSANALTEIDRQNIKLAAELEMDFLAVSFVRTGDDVQEARDLFEAAGGKGHLVAKVERTEAVENIDSIIDAADIVMPSKQGAARAMVGALADAGINREQVGYVNAHGTGTAANDKTECAAVADVFGPHADNLMISSTKSMHGHLIGGTGAVELLACIMALRDGVIAPTIGYQEADPECALDVVPNTARDANVDVVLSNAFAFGGLNAVLALRRI